MSAHMASRESKAWAMGRIAGERYATARLRGRSPHEPVNPFIVPAVGTVWANRQTGSTVEITGHDRELLHFKYLSGPRQGKDGWRKADRFRYHFVQEMN